jgi:lysozyme family protein
VADAWRSPLQPNIPLLPEALQATVFDMQVNAGGNAIKILQRLLGPYTATAVKRIYDQAGAYLVDAYGIARRDYYFRIGDRRTASRKYARTRRGGKGGWIKRAEEFMQPKYHMTDAEFKLRISRWA